MTHTLARLEGVDVDVLNRSLPWPWESFGEYLAMLKAKGVYPNVAVLASHTVMRTAVMGGEGSERPSTPEELATGPPCSDRTDSR